MKETQQQIELRKEAIAFAEWVRDNDVYSCHDRWNFHSQYVTTEQLYSLFKQQPNQ